jgi:hypothetical protein
MASYFSNHSGSRFPGSGATPPPANNPVVTARPPPVARAPSSKHFSTSVNSEDKTPQGKEKGIVGTGGIGAGAVHPLRTTYVRTSVLFKPEFSLTCLGLFLFLAGFSSSANNERRAIRSQITRKESRKYLLSDRFACPLFKNMPIHIQRAVFSRLNLFGHSGRICSLHRGFYPPPTTCSFMQVYVDPFGRTR